METSNQQPNQQTYYDQTKSLMNSEGIKKKFEELLGKRAPQFITSVLQIVSGSTDLKNAIPESIYNAAATAAILDLPLNNNLQFAHIVPYKNTKKGITEAQFQLGWRGGVQLAQRSRQYKTINVTDIREGELKSRNRLTGECVFEFIDDEEVRLKTPIIGFVSYFSLITGFEKTVYWPVAKIIAHAKKYSKTYNREDSKWNTDFEAMAAKTVLKDNLSKWGPLSVEMAQAFQADQAVILGINGQEIEVDYVDNPIEDTPELSEEEAAEIEKQTRDNQAKQAEQDLFNKVGKDKKPK